MKNGFVRVFATYHRIQSQGYYFYKTITKLKEEYEKLNQLEIRDLVKVKKKTRKKKRKERKEKKKEREKERKKKEKREKGKERKRKRKKKKKTRFSSHTATSTTLEGLATFCQ